MQLTEKDTIFQWTPEEVRDELRSSGWTLVDGVWKVHLHGKPPCFRDKVVEENPNWIAYYFIEINDRKLMP